MSSDCQTVSFYDRKIGRNAAESANVFVGSYVRAVSVRQIHCQATAAPAVSLAERPPAKQEQQDTGHDEDQPHQDHWVDAHVSALDPGINRKPLASTQSSGAHDAPPPQWQFRPSRSLIDLRCGRSYLLDANSADADENSGHDHTEDESTDMGEERDTTATRVVWVDQRVVALEELVQKPATEEDPRRDPDREPPHERKDA